MSQFSLHPQLETDSIFVRDLPLCQLRLQNQKTIPWLVLVPRLHDMREIYQLGVSDRATLMEEITEASRALESLYAPDKINVGALGNIVPQLHVHVIARFKTDAAWPAPVWGRVPAETYPTDAIDVIIEKLNRFFQS
ncbi:MAG TPA: HIT family protein [Alphaproteobacteria bacterium]|nr:HIT family protein [Alphaproteobacteria bacterium]